MSSAATARKMVTLIRKIPPGRVATYGQIASLVGRPDNSRQVGTILRTLPEDSDVPWHRVVNAQGRISDRGNRAAEGLQRFLLHQEGVRISKSGRIDLAAFQWNPRQKS